MNFESRGYVKWNTDTDGAFTTESFQRRVDTDDGFSSSLCQCNGKLLINVKRFEYTINGVKTNSCEIAIIHENQYGTWCDLKIYSLNEDDLMENIEKYESKLIAMWEVFSK